MVGVWFTEQLAVPTTPATKAQLFDGLNVPVLLVAKVAEPVGVTAPVPELSVTVAVQLVGVFSATLAGAHETVVVVDRIVDVTVNAALVLPVWTESPANEPVIP